MNRSVSRAQVPTPFPSSLLADVITEASKDGPEERWLKLQINQGYGATGVPASIDA